LVIFALVIFPKKSMKDFSNSKKSYKNGYGDPKGGFTMETGSVGFFVTCSRNKERQSIDEIIKLFEEHAEKSYQEPEEVCEDIEDALEKELKTLKKKRLFSGVPTGMDCTVFIRVLHN
jgi:predicted small metal-binding protein